jgi:hypothetical protein
MGQAVRHPVVKTTTGCLILLMVTFGGMIAFADLSVAKSEQAAPAGIVTVVAFVAGLVLLIRAIRSYRGL